ncbi:MAG: hypothetical protein KAS23_01765 [Anaerohalosphaera sp.]|nr:hypothetical protein [Anaerohalosphaera sp.]
MKEFFFVLLGAFCSTVGGIATIWFQAKKARQIRREELIGEQGLEVAKKALSLTDQIQTLRIQGDAEDVITLLYKEGEWFSMNQILLPHIFVENWRSMRLGLRKLKRRESQIGKMQDGPDRDKIINEMGDMDTFLDDLAAEMERCLREELGLKKVCIKKPDYKN